MLINCNTIKTEGKYSTVRLFLRQQEQPLYVTVTHPHLTVALLGCHYIFGNPALFFPGLLAMFLTRQGRMIMMEMYLCTVDVTCLFRGVPPWTRPTTLRCRVLEGRAWTVNDGIIQVIWRITFVTFHLCTRPPLESSPPPHGDLQRRKPCFVQHTSKALRILAPALR